MVIFVTFFEKKGGESPLKKCSQLWFWFKN